MPRQPNLIARDTRILAAHSAGATIPQIALAEQLDPAIVRTTLRRHDVPFPRGRRPIDDAVATRLADRAWLAAEYATKSAPEIAAEPAGGSAWFLRSVATTGSSEGVVFSLGTREGRRHVDNRPLVGRSKGERPVQRQPPPLSGCIAQWVPASCPKEGSPWCIW